jgi:hypothetical protein
MTDSKNWYTSKTLIGGIISFITMILMILKIDVDAGIVTELVQSVFALIGTVLVFVGRLKANKRLK